MHKRNNKNCKLYVFSLESYFFLFWWDTVVSHSHASHGWGIIQSRALLPEVDAPGYHRLLNLVDLMR